MKVVDNFLPKAYQDALEELLLGDDFPWYVNKRTVGNVEDSKLKYPHRAKNVFDCGQLTHGFVGNGQTTSTYFPIVSLLLHHLMLTENLRTDNPIRVKANLNHPANTNVNNIHYPIHIDKLDAAKDEFFSCIYYVNDCDGDTMFFNEGGKEEISRVHPKKGRIVYFDSTIPHAGQPPKTHYLRCVINMVFNLKGTNEPT
jgi:hypothetical protein